MFYYDTWSGLLEKQTDIEAMIQNQRPRSSLQIHDLTITTRFLYGLELYKLTVDGRSVFLKPVTMKYLFNLKDSVSCLYNDFRDVTSIVSAKFRQFVKVLRGKEIVDMEQAEVAIRNSNHFSREDLIDCELLACALHDIITEANKLPTMSPSNVINLPPHVFAFE